MRSDSAGVVYWQVGINQFLWASADLFIYV